MPVRLPPGRARLATKPYPTASPLVKTIGIVDVAFFAARAAPPATITSTLRPTRSAANAGNRRVRMVLYGHDLQEVGLSRPADVWCLSDVWSWPKCEVLTGSEIVCLSG